MAASPALADDAAAVLSRAPTSEQANELAQQLIERVVADDVTVEWLTDHVDPWVLPGPPSDAELLRWQQTLAPTSQVGSRLAQRPRVLATHASPRTQRVVWDTTPPLTVVIRQHEDGARIDAITATSCALCDEPERFVRDLVRDAQRGPGSHRLLPGVELYVGPRLRDVPGTRDTRWVAEWTAQRGQELHTLLSDARVERTQERAFRLHWPDGRTDTWSVVWAEQRWQVDYDALAPDSPLRLDPAQARTRRSRRAEWEPTLRPDGPALLLGASVLGAGIEPLTDAVWLVVLDVDDDHPEAVRVDPVTQTVTQRLGLGEVNVQPNAGEGWYVRRHVSLASRGETLAVSLPGRVIEATPASGTHRRIGGREVIALSATAGGIWVSQADGTVRSPAPRVHRHSVPVVAMQPSTGVGVRQDSTLVSLTSPERAVGGTACSGRVVGAAASPQDDGWVMACDDEQASALVFVDDHGVPSLRVRYQPSDSGVVAWAPHGQALAATQGPDDALVFVSSEGRVTPTCATGVKQVVWSHSSEHLVTVHRDGTARWWSLRQLKAR